jgi:DNA-binding IclR family transcriptional regulator
MNNTLVKGLRLVDLLAHKRTAMGVSELARAMNLPKSDVHRVLQSLVAERYVVRHEGGIYSASIKLWELGSAALLGFDLRRAAGAAMEQLMRATDETVHLAVLDGREIVYLHRIDTDNPVRAYSHIGGRALAHCVATGKAILAFQAPDALAQAAQHLAPVTPRTMTDPGLFLAAMQKVRRNGYALNRGEWRDGVNGVAAPIFDGTGAVIAAVGISGPASRLTLARLRSVAPLVMEAARTLSAGLHEAGSHASLLSVTRHWARAV